MPVKPSLHFADFVRFSVIARCPFSRCPGSVIVVKHIPPPPGVVSGKDSTTAPSLFLGRFAGPACPQRDFGFF